MINRNEAYNMCQKANRENWTNLLRKRIGETIKNAAITGSPNVEIVISDYIIGAENISEYIEMLHILKHTLTNNGYSHKILPNGNLLIQWK